MKDKNYIAMTDMSEVKHAADYKVVTEGEIINAARAIQSTRRDAIYKYIDERKSLALPERVIQWAKDREIFTKATPYKQANKTLEEVGELILAIGQGDKEAIRDAIGDIAVTIIIQAHMHGWTLDECLESAYEQIKDRRGSMQNGTFVKEV